MKKLAVLFISVLALAACRLGDEESSATEQTLFIYMPWSSDLTAAFSDNLADMETAIRENGGMLRNNRIVVFFCTSKGVATMFEMRLKKGKNERKTLKEYTNLAFTTQQGITGILNDVKRFAPARRYAMIIGCHGMGWLPVGGSRARGTDAVKYHWEAEGGPMTRFFGGTSSDVQTDVTTLAAAIAGAGIKMDYILFDDCYMSSIEVAYDLKDVADYLIACPTEIMAYGFPYHKIGKYLVGSLDLQNVVDEFSDFYSTYELPYGTIGVTVCAEVEGLAARMKEINRQFGFDQSKLNSIQKMDGYSPVIFFDLGDYVSNLCADEALLARFNEQLERTVPSRFARHTARYYSRFTGPTYINVYTGSTISDPSVNPLAADTKTRTAWYAATH